MSSAYLDIETQNTSLRLALTMRFRKIVSLSCSMCNDNQIYNIRRAGVEVRQSKLEVVVEVGVGFGVEAEAYRYQPRGWVGGLKRN